MWLRNVGKFVAVCLLVRFGREEVVLGMGSSLQELSLKKLVEGAILDDIREDEYFRGFQDRQAALKAYMSSPELKDLVNRLIRKIPEFSAGHEELVELALTSFDQFLTRDLCLFETLPESLHNRVQELFLAEHFLTDLTDSYSGIAQSLPPTVSLTHAAEAIFARPSEHHSIFRILDARNGRYIVQGQPLSFFRYYDFAKMCAIDVKRTVARTSLGYLGVQNEPLGFPWLLPHLGLVVLSEDGHPTIHRRGRVPVRLSVASGSREFVWSINAVSEPFPGVVMIELGGLELIKTFLRTIEEQRNIFTIQNPQSKNAVYIVVDTNDIDRLSAAFSEEEALEEYWGTEMHIEENWTASLSAMEWMEPPTQIVESGEMALMIKDGDCIVVRTRRV